MNQDQSDDQSKNQDCKFHKIEMNSNDSDYLKQEDNNKDSVQTDTNQKLLMTSRNVLYM